MHRGCHNERLASMKSIVWVVFALALMATVIVAGIYLPVFVEGSTVFEVFCWFIGLIAISMAIELVGGLYSLIHETRRYLSDLREVRKTNQAAAEMEIRATSERLTLWRLEHEASNPAAAAGSPHDLGRVPPAHVRNPDLGQCRNS
jgi:hypothetical protein